VSGRADLVRGGLTEGLGRLAALVILAFAFRSLRAALLPVATALVSVGVGTLGLLAFSGVFTMNSTAPALGSMLGLAVGIDYSLFIVSRHQSQLRAGMDPVESAGRAVATSGSAVVFAGASVVVALAALAVVDIPFLTVMGLGTAGTVVVAVLFVCRRSLICGVKLLEMNEKELVKLSKRMSRWLRHDPQAICLALDPADWIDVNTLIHRTREHGPRFSRADLDQVVAENNKQRFEFDSSGTRIRARQGHSVAVDLGYATAEPPTELYHGTAEIHVAAILREGALPMSRHAVHLSQDIDTARKVGSRHGKPVILVSTRQRCTPPATASRSLETGCGWSSSYPRNSSCVYLLRLRRARPGLERADFVERIPSEPVRRPLVLRKRTERLVESDRRLVPIEHLPLDPTVPARHRDPSQLSKQRPPMAAAAPIRPDIEVFEIDAVPAKPGGEGQEPQGEADRLTSLVVHGQIRENRRRWAEERFLQLFLSRHGLLRSTLILSQLADHRENFGDIGRRSGSDHQLSVLREWWIQFPPLSLRFEVGKIEFG
jgi:putative RNA 2'-phosphotransferase